MTDSKTAALETLAEPSPATTYQTYVRPHQLKRGDTYTEPVGRGHRSVVIDKVTHGELRYRGATVQVLFVYGVDLHNGTKVIYTRTSWEFLEVARIGTAPQYRTASKVLDQFVY